MSDTTIQNEDNFNDEELNALLEEAEAEQGGAEPTQDVQKELEEAKRKNAILQRLLDKKNKEPKKEDAKPITKNNLEDDIAELKFFRKVDQFAEDNGLTRKQAEQVLKLNPNATAETLQDPFFKAGIEALSKKQRVEENMPRGSTSRSSKPQKKYGEMTADEKKEWYASRVQK